MYEILVATPADLEKGKPFKVSLHRIDGAESQPHDRRSRSCIAVYPGLDGVILNEHFEGKRMIGELSFWDKPILGPEGGFPREKIDEEFEELDGLDMDTELDELVSDGE